MLVGVLQLTEEVAFLWFAYGTRPFRVPQIVAAGLLGRQSFSLGATSVLLGLLLHLAVAFSVVAAYALGSSRFLSLQRHVLGSGLLYGLAVYAFMRVVVLPTSALPEELKRPTLLSLLNGVLGHAFLVGLPTAWAVHRSFLPHLVRTPFTPPALGAVPPGGRGHSRDVTAARRPQADETRRGR
jgi:hypothetical protein